MQSTIIWYATLFIFQFIFGLLGLLVTGWFSRQREYRADAGSAALVGATSMIAALEQLQTANDDSEVKKKVGLPESMTALGISGKAKSLLSTHPPLEVRIQALKERR